MILLFLNFYLYGCFACLYVSVPHSCLITTEARCEHWIFLGLELKIGVNHHVGAGKWGPPQPLKEQPVLLAAQPSLWSQPVFKTRSLGTLIQCATDNTTTHSLIPFILT